MKIMFRTGWGSYKNPIKEFKVIKTSEKSVWYKSNFKHGKSVDCRELLYTINHRWHETKEEAKTHLIIKAETEVQRCENSLINAKNNLDTLLEALK